SQQLEFMVEETLKRYGIYDLRNRKTDEISYGEKKKVAIAGLSTLNPLVALLDEPYAGMDSEGRKFITDYIIDLKSKNKTVIITSHELGEFISLVDEILYIRNNNLLESLYHEEAMPVFLRNILLLSKYGYLCKPL
ncbi:ATP-binding cassette domain-containing protein, partial [Escherichia coli]|uniref:ATP-binding cassette domain-containing protein n=1 Tax=Escherichia coli TaxID=562 RepID=UPI00128F422D